MVEICILLACIIVAILSTPFIYLALYNREVDRKNMEARIAAAEKKLYGKVINFKDIQEWQKLKNSSITTEVSNTPVDKEAKYEMALKKMQERRAKAPKARPVKHHHVSTKSSAPSFKDRVGGTRRAS